MTLSEYLVEAVAKRKSSKYKYESLDNLKPNSKYQDFIKAFKSCDFIKVESMGGSDMDYVRKQLAGKAKREHIPVYTILDAGGYEYIVVSGTNNVVAEIGFGIYDDLGTIWLKDLSDNFFNDSYSDDVLYDGLVELVNMLSK